MSVREACRQILHDARTTNGDFIPLTAAELVPMLQAVGFPVSERDTEALLRELAADGDVVEIDRSAGYRWGSAA
jgi:hypothetical protein